VRGQRDHRQRTDQVADRLRDAEADFQHRRQDHRLDREEDEGERRIDQRRDRGADIAEAGATGQQVDVHAVARGVDGDRQAGQEDQRADH
jgi:hypothetical protein